MALVDELLYPFAQSINVKVTALNKLALTKSQRSRLLESISDDIKKCTNFLIPDVSEAAANEANRMKIDLRTKNWHDQTTFDRKRTTFHFEHVVPVSAIRKSCINAQSEEQVFTILSHDARIAWILKEEDKQLTRLGYRHKRDNPDAAYTQAGITLQRKTQG